MTVKNGQYPANSAETASMDDTFRRFAMDVVQDFPIGFKINLLFVAIGQPVEIQPLVLTPGIRGFVHSALFILIDEALPTAKQHVCLYHELGHLDYWLRTTQSAMNETDNEYHAYHYCLSRLEKEGQLNLLRDELDVIQAHIDDSNSSNRTDSFAQAWGRLFSCAEWNHWVALAATVR